MKKYWWLSQFNWSWNSPVTLCCLLRWFSHLAIWTPVSEPVHVDLFEVKEENKDLEANTQADISEAKGGFQVEDGIEGQDLKNWSNFLEETRSEILQQVSTEQYQNRQLTVRHSHRGHRRPGTRRSSNPSPQAQCSPKNKEKELYANFYFQITRKILTWRADKRLSLPIRSKHETNLKKKENVYEFKGIILFQITRNLLTWRASKVRECIK